MAVAVKNAPVAAPSKLLDRLPVFVLVGAVYVLGSLAVVLWAVPELWFTLTQFPRDNGTGLVLLALIDTAAAGGLGYLGYRLLHARERPPGAVAGVALAVVGLVAVLLLTRWVSLWLEYWVYANHLFGDSGPSAGLALTGAALAALLALGGWLLTRPRTVAFLQAVEAQGWFSAAGYKPLQGQRVRRGTIVGLLLLGGTGVWTLMTNGPMRNVPDPLDKARPEAEKSWVLNVPFTGQTVVDSPGDAVVVLRDAPAAVKDRVWVRDPGASGLPPQAFVPAAQFREAFAAAVGAAAAAAAPDDRKNLDPEKLKEEVGKADVAVLAYFDSEDSGQLRAAGLPQLAELDNLRRKQAKISDDDLRRKGWKRVQAPAGAFQMDQLALRDRNDKLAHDFVKVTKDSQTLQDVDPKLVRGAVVPRTEYEKAVAEVKDKKAAGEVGPADPAAGPTTYRVVPLLPALAYTVPILLLAVTLWLAWRTVNLPPFADFLIATEAELNKVSWTTRPRLIQDTIVVLVTVALMAGYLFLMDQTWRTVLSLPFVKVLQFPEETSDKNKSAEQKPW